MEFEKLLKSSWEQFLKSIVKLVLFVLVGGLLCITIVLIPTAIGGMIRGILKYARDGIEPEFNELWNFEGYVQILLLIIVSGLLISIGFMLLVIPGILLMVWWMYAIYFLVDKNMGFWEAMSASREVVSSTGFFNNLVLLLIMSILNALGNTVLVGGLFTGPFGLLLITNAYLELSGSSKPAAAA